MTFPSSLIASIQFISASHARPQSIKLALFTKKLLSYNNPRNQNAGIMGKAQPDDDGRNKQIFKFPPSRQEASQSRCLRPGCGAKPPERSLSGSPGTRQVARSQRLYLQPLWGHRTVALKETWLRALCFQVSPFQKVLGALSKGCSLKCP